jgi:uncharacterized membrane protein YqiK
VQYVHHCVKHYYSNNSIAVLKLYATNHKFTSAKKTYFAVVVVVVVVVVIIIIIIIIIVIILPSSRPSDLLRSPAISSDSYLSGQVKYLSLESRTLPSVYTLQPISSVLL